MWAGNCRSSPHTLGMSMSITRTGTSKQFPSFYNSQLNALAGVNAVIDPEVNNDHLRPSIAVAALLHGPASQTAWCKSAYHRGISGCLPLYCFDSPRSILKRRPSDPGSRDLDVALLGKFLNRLEVNRRNQPRTRNNRLAADCGDSLEMIESPSKATSEIASIRISDEPWFLNAPKQSNTGRGPICRDGMRFAPS